MEKIKLLQISETFVSGVYTYIKQICNFLENDDRFELHVIYSPDREETKLDQISSDFSSKVHLHPISMKREISPKNDLKSVFAIRNKIKEIKPDLIHLHSSKAGILGRVASFGLNSKVFYTPHGYSFLREDVSKSKQNFFYSIEKYAQFLFPLQTIASGDAEFRLALQIDKKTTMIRNGINVDKLSSFITPYQNTRPIIGTSGRVSAQKNPRLFNEIAKTNPHIDFIWIGDGELEFELTSSNIQIIKWLPYNEYLNITNSFDIFLSTSLWEGLPFNILEAMALKKPIITNNIESNLITIDEGVNGFVCSTINDFNQAINKTLDNKESMGEASYNRALDLFNQEKNLKQLIEFYLSNIKN